MTRIGLSSGKELRELLFEPAALERLAALGEFVLVGPDQGIPDGLQVVVTTWDSPPLPPESPDLRLVAHTGGSIRRIVPRALVASGVVVTQASAQMVPPVAEFALTLSLTLARHVHAYDRAFGRGVGWPVAAERAFGRSLASMRIGVLGASRVGRAYIEMLRALGANDVSVADPYLTPAAAAELGVSLVGLDELFSSSELLAVHAPLTAETRGMVDTRLLALLPDDAIVVNTARAAILEERAVVAEARSGRLRFGLDVFDLEPLPADHPLRGLPNVLLTPHVAGATRDARRAQGAFAVAEVARFLAGEALLSRVSVEDYDRIA